MTLYELSKVLPDKYRQQLLEGNVIYKAIPNSGDAHMKMLVIYWKNYFEPGNQDIDETCNTCLNEILKKFKSLLPYLVQVEKEYQLLES